MNPQILMYRLFDMLITVYRMLIRTGDNENTENIDKYVYVCYRQGFPEVQGYTNDCGWGCTIRSSQMMLGNACLQLNPLMNKDELMHLVGDFKTSIFSLQNIVEAGLQYGINAGEWFPPSIVAKSIRDISNEKENKDNLKFNVIVYPEEYDAKRCANTLLLLSIRLGVKKIENIYRDEILKFFKSPNSVGIVGGKRSSSYYFIGLVNNSNDGNSDQPERILYLDPHELRQHKNCDFTPKRIDSIIIDDMEPSVTFAFLIHNEEEYETILTNFSAMFWTIPSESDKEYNYELIDDEEEDICFVNESSFVRSFQPN